MIGGCHTAWPITTDALENEALRLNIFTVCLESLTTMMVLIMELFIHLPSHMWLIRDAGETWSSKVCQTTQLLSYQWLLSAAVCLGGKIMPCSLTAGSLSALNYTKLVQHISLPEQEPECCRTCLTRSKQCSLNWLGMMYLEPAAICLRHDAEYIKTKWVSNSFIMHCGNNLCQKRQYAPNVGLGSFVQEICEHSDMEEQQEILSLCLKSLIWLYSWFLHKCKTIWCLLHPQ